MKPARRGARVRVINTDPTDEYEVGEVCIVSRVDTAGTFEGRSVKTGVAKGWLRWNQVAPAGERVGWEFLAQALSPASRRLLEAFDGHTELVLSAAVEEELLLDLPGLAEALQAALETEASEPRPPAAESRKPVRSRKQEASAAETGGETTGRQAAGQEDFDVAGHLIWEDSP